MKEVEDKEFSSMLENYKKIVQIPFEEYQDLTKEETKENFQYMVHKMANEDIKIFENLELKDKLIKLQEEENKRLNNIIKEVKEYIEKYLKDHMIEDQPDEQSIFYDEKGYYIPNAKEQLLDILKGSK